ncbi:MAG TPA: hypothetical protein VF176_03475 [Solirubrobacterales bacterium]
MKADYDSEANALSIDLVEVPRWDNGTEIDDTYCNVALFQGTPVNVELLNPSDHLDLLDVVAKRFALDVVALRATAQAALAAPNRVVTVTLDTAGATA